jgi:hypothetical protein
MTKIVISSGHGKYVRGAAGPPPWGLDEVDEARRVVEAVADKLEELGVETVTIHDDVSHDQDSNLEYLVDAHNAQKRDLDVSVHFNAYEVTDGERGVEVLYYTQQGLSAELSAAMASAADLPDRGAKYRDNLYWLKHTNAPAVLIETAFCDAKGDCAQYEANFHDIAQTIADVLAGEEAVERPPEKPELPELPEVPTEDVLFRAEGTCSHFGGPRDEGVAPDEGLAFIFEIDETVGHLFLPYQPKGTTGLARRLNPFVHYIACRWDYSVTSKEMLRESKQVALVRSKRTGIAHPAIPADWGPHEEKTGRIADLSPALMRHLDCTTDDEVEVIYPYRE